MADDADFYIEKINPNNPDQYEYMGLWVDMTVKEEIITVKDAADVKFEVKLTRHGPLVDGLRSFGKSNGNELAMRWTAYEMLETLPFHSLNTAGSIDDIEKAVDDFKCPGQNWVYADKKGNIGYWAAVGIPVRDGFSGAVPVPKYSRGPLRY